MRLRTLIFALVFAASCAAQSTGVVYVCSQPTGNQCKLWVKSSPPTLSIGTVTTLPAGSRATASITGTAPNFVLNLGIPAGQNGTNGINGTNGTNGTNGQAATLIIGTVTTLSSDAPATVSNSGTQQNAVINFGIPSGQSGRDGQGATITIGTVTALSPGTTPTVVNVGTPQNAIFNIGLTTGNTGGKGDPGSPGLKGDKGDPGPVGPDIPGLTYRIETDGTTTLILNGQAQKSGAINLDGMSLTCTASGPRCD
jgi:hypothetical protein